jgi:RNase H-like domain found in reverse transcriptase/Reverse transcriptase (RNA-dependent DNA polymerase)
MKRVALGKSKVLLRNEANILKIIIYEPFILKFSIWGLIFHNRSKKCLNWFTDDYRHLPMGVNQSPDIAQEIMECVLSSIMKEIECYIDDITAFSDDWESHKTLLNKLLTKLQNAGFTGNPLKCEWAVQETNFLGHWLTPTRIKPWEKKVRGILNMQAPTNIKQIRAFLGMVGYYHDMWPRCSHILSPLTELTGKKAFVWEDKHQQAFEQMKALIATDVLLAYPNHNKPFDIETDASDYQLGAIIKQDNRPVAYYTRKLNSAQKNYTTIKKERLSIVETLKEF